MKKLFATIAALLMIYGLSAQDVAVNSSNPTVDLSLMYKIDNPTAYPAPQTYMSMMKQDPCRQKITGRNLLISGGCFLAVGAASYGSAWTMLSDGNSVGDVFSIGGITCMGISVPLFIAGSILYVKGKNHCVNLSSNGLTINF